MTQFRWKKVILPAVLSTLLATAGNSFAQRGGGGGGPGGSSGGWGGGGTQGGGGPGGGGSMRGGMNSDSSFDRLLQSYGGSGDTLDYSKVPADTRQRTDTFAKMTGGQPMPTSGTLSRAQYKTEFDTRMQTMQSRFGRGPGGSTAPAPTTGVAATGTAGAPTVVMVGPGGAESNTTMTTSPSTVGSMGGPGGSMGGGRGGWGGSGGGDSMDPDARFKAMDINPADGKISREEAQNSSGRLGRSFDQSDTNKDGFIDQAEYRAYFAAATGGMSMGGGGGSWGGGQGGNPWNNMQDPTKQPPVEVEDEKPVIIRYGKLPTGLPDWFTAGDTNRDAQISLFEYCRFFGGSTEQIAEFKNYDLNGDSLVTAEEYLRYVKTKYSNGTPNLNGYAAPILASPVVGGPPQRGGMNGPTQGFGQAPAGTIPPGGDNRFSRDRTDSASDKAKEKEKDAAKAESKKMEKDAARTESKKDAAKTESKDQRSNQPGGGKDRGSRSSGVEPSK